MHAVENNYRTVLIEDACRGVNEKQIEVKRSELNESGCIFVDSNVVCRIFYLMFFFFNEYIRYLEWLMVKIVDLKCHVECL
jgi:hypothetical protein